MNNWNKVSTSIDRREVFLFISFYFLSTIIYYTASWISWGAFEGGHPSYFNVEEFFASGGAQFMISFCVTVPIWYLTCLHLQKYSLLKRLLSHLIFMPIYVAICYFSLVGITELFGWAMYWGGYKTIWTLYTFMLFYLVQFGFIHAYGYFKKYKQEMKEKAILKESTLKSEITALKAQLNPHFLHNTLNSINASIPPENEQTRELIIRLSDLFRYQNYASQNEWVSIKEEVKFIQNYLELMKIRLKERLEYNIQVSETLYDYQIAPMLLQPLVENAITHGISKKVEPSKLSIKIHSNGDKVEFSIEDTGIGIRNKQDIFTSGLGLSNTKMRLDKIYSAELKVEDYYPSGTKISFAI